ncbi:Murein DD-endopeptidase MepM [Roseivivax sp. THAF40]|uniref:M23 family metallopeptidase n=1 Tax=unclassified Roseivivax TaxID=2639302 RepID=UPI0012689E9B|nr:MULTISPECIES: M23 family metallopeptidase [unclassified Roseivivax]QFS84300.1 Murein DD-endopeptidase MepM [Roseivivax sp. THAF197b]QFT48128.1 Murein DD-endopeptidase MepM [Roseivivax sp. THAF40]
MRGALFALFVLTSAAPTAAEVSVSAAPFLHWPVDCTLGQTCVIEDYVDADPGPGQSDYTCGIKSRDGHRGTDIALPTDTDMQAGVAVLAAAAGRIAAVRDGVADRRLTDPESVADQECGNGVRIAHENGLQTLYCHLARGSIRVAPGDRVAAGDFIGQIGMSGQTNYPHLHFTVLKDETVIDPFAANPEAACGPDTPTLWLDPPAYDRAGLFTAGFSRGVPDFAEVQSGAARVAEIAPDDPLVAYTNSFHAASGDVLHFAVAGPEGPVFEHSILLKAPQLQTFRAYGNRAPASGWQTGPYSAVVRLMRGDTLIAVRQAYVTVR